MSGNVFDVTDDSFKAEVLESNTPVLVDFWAPWCGPCKTIAPVIEELATQYADSLKVVKVNVDENPESPAQYHVRGIPNLVLFKNGELQDQIVGAVTKQEIESAIKKIL
jgi:thioredoxin 1